MQRHANAQVLLRAVNNHDALVAALKKAIAVIEDEAEALRDDDDVICANALEKELVQLRAALAAAKDTA